MPQAPGHWRRWSFGVAGLAAACLVGAGVVVWYRFTPIGSRGPIAEATVAYDRGELENAGTIARRYLKEHPDDPPALRMTARIAARQGRDDTAINLFSRLSVADLEAIDFSMLGRALARKGNAEGAIKALETALAGAPNDPETLDALAELYIQNDRYFAAEPIAARLAAIPDRQARGNLLLGTAREQLNDFRGAAAALRECLAVDPELKSAGRNPIEPFRLLFVRSLLRSGQAAEAAEYLRKGAGEALAGEQNWLLSRALMQQGEWSRAAALLKAEPTYRTQQDFGFEPGRFVGGGRCAECHREISSQLLASRHATTFGQARDLRKLPLPEGPLVDPGNAGVKHRLERKNGDIRFETQLNDQVFQAIARYAFGSPDHFASLVGPDSSGQLRMLRMSRFESPNGSGWGLTTNLPLLPSEVDEYLGKKMDGDDGLRRCLGCHTTNFRAIMDGQGPEAADHSIGCEACHGPGGNHVASVDAGFGDPAIAGARNASAAEVQAICGRCHTMHRSQAVSAPRTDPLWMRFPSLTLTWSRCFTASDGKLSCLSCHDPHQNADSSVSRNEARCLACHSRAPDGPSPSPATAHSGVARGDDTGRLGRSRNSSSASVTPCPVNATTGCLGCHMPRTWDQKTSSFKTDHFIRIR